MPQYDIVPQSGVLKGSIAQSVMKLGQSSGIVLGLLLPIVSFGTPSHAAEPTVLPPYQPIIILPTPKSQNPVPQPPSTNPTPNPIPNPIPNTIPQPTPIVSPTPEPQPSVSPAPLPTSAPTPQPTVKPAAIEVPVKLVVQRGKRRVLVYQGERVVAKYPIAIGKPGWETPIGEFSVLTKEKNPTFKSFKTGRIIKPGPDNPLGPRWIGIWTDGKTQLGFHGTNEPELIGQAVSHGCIRMHNKDAVALYDYVNLGTVVEVVP